jgi:hypothetical protein
MSESDRDTPSSASSTSTIEPQRQTETERDRERVSISLAQASGAAYNEQHGDPPYLVHRHDAIAIDRHILIERNELDGRWWQSFIAEWSFDAIEIMRADRHQ